MLNVHILDPSFPLLQNYPIGVQKDVYKDAKCSTVFKNKALEIYMSMNKGTD